LKSTTLFNDVPIILAAKNQRLRNLPITELDDKAKEMALAMLNGCAPKIGIAKYFNVTRQTIYTLLKDIEL
jgi:hypothetical protein